ncbi:MAG: Holliday junction branch migration protein RuvA [Firmicutes bacterium]|nr:Holliday junction branch migration protein RuvA [Bacillota bacterium]
MYNYISGKLIEKRDGAAVVDVGGIGYEIMVSDYTLNALPAEGAACKLFTYLQVKDDGMILHGFAAKPEKEVFLKLITVSGIGPKMAGTILSGISPNELISAVIMQNLAALSGIKGVGKKTAERLLLELKSKIDSVAVGAGDVVVNTTLPDTVAEQAMTVLVDWGVNKTEAYSLAAKNYVNGDTLEELLAKALKAMGR